MLIFRKGAREIYVYGNGFNHFYEMEHLGFKLITVCKVDWELINEECIKNQKEWYVWYEKEQNKKGVIKWMLHSLSKLPKMLKK